MNFAERLRKITVKKDAKFVDYRPETGSWVFKVDHFSRYGFNDSDDETETASQEVASKKAAESIQKTDPKLTTKTSGNQEKLQHDLHKKSDQSKETTQVCEHGQCGQDS